MHTKFAKAILFSDIYHSRCTHHIAYYDKEEFNRPDFADLLLFKRLVNN